MITVGNILRPFWVQVLNRERPESCFSVLAPRRDFSHTMALPYTVFVGFFISAHGNANSTSPHNVLVQSGQQCIGTLKENTDVNVRSYAEQAASTVDECCAACTADSKCKAAVFIAARSHCQLKDQAKLVPSVEGPRVTILPSGSPPAPPAPPAQKCSIMQHHGRCTGRVTIAQMALKK